MGYLKGFLSLSSMEGSLLKSVYMKPAINYSKRTLFVACTQRKVLKFCFLSFFFLLSQLNWDANCSPLGYFLWCGNFCSSQLFLVALMLWKNTTNDLFEIESLISLFLCGNFVFIEFKIILFLRNNFLFRFFRVKKFDFCSNKFEFFG